MAMMTVLGCAPHARPAEPGQPSSEEPRVAATEPATSAKTDVPRPRDPCAGSDLDLNDLLSRPECESADSPSELALHGSPVSPLVARVVRRRDFITIPGPQNTFDVTYSNPTDRAAPAYFRYDPNCVFYHWNSDQVRLGVRFAVYDPSGELIPSAVGACELEPRRSRTVRVVVAAGGSAHMTIGWSPERIDERNQVHPLRPGKYDVRLRMPVAGTVDVPGHALTELAIAFDQPRVR